jgi:hypothetical protein
MMIFFSAAPYFSKQLVRATEKRVRMNESKLIVDIPSQSKGLLLNSSCPLFHRSNADSVLVSSGLTGTYDELPGRRRRLEKESDWNR